MVESSIQQVLNDLRQCTAHIDGAGGLPNRINQIRGALASIRKKLDTCNGPGTSNSSQAIQNAIDAARLAIFALHAYVNTARQWQQQVGVGSSATVGADNLTIDSNGGSGTISDRSAEDAPVNNDSLGDASGFTATVGPGTVHYGGTDQAAPGAVGSEGLDKGDGERKDRDSSQSQRNNCDSVDDLIIEINRRQRRHADGKFADKNGGARTYAESENIGRKRYAARMKKEGTPVKEMIPKQRKAEVDGCDHGRFYDGIALQQDGTWVGIEVKYGRGYKNAKQREFDALVSPYNPARVKLGDGRVIEITEVITERVVS